MHNIASVSRTYPLRKPEGFTPTVQRWSAALPNKHHAYFVEFLGLQGPDEASVNASAFFTEMKELFDRADGPDVTDHARHIDENGAINHIIAAYWIDEGKHKNWSENFGKNEFWNSPERLDESFGLFRESLYIPVGQQETLYWPDYPTGLSRSENIAMYPTPYCGYFGAMRDRIPMSATENFPSSIGNELPAPISRKSKGGRWHVKAPKNLTVIRSGTYWGACDDEQLEDFQTKLQKPLEKGMDFLKDNDTITGCCSLRYQDSLNEDFTPKPEAHALGYFLSLSHLENWSEGHKSHHAIFAAAMARYKKYGSKNQLRTWHEVYVLPDDRQLFEYINCHPNTGLLPYFDASLYKS